MGSRQQPSPLVWKTQPASFSLVTFNVLADDFVGPGSFPYCPSEKKNLAYRLKLLTKILADLNASIFCLQEVDQESASQKCVQSILRDLGYEFHHAIKEFTKQGVLLAWKKKDFYLQSARVIDTSDFYHPALQTRLQHNLGIFMILGSRRKGGKIAVGTTHLHWNPVQQELKYMQMVVILSQFQQFSKDVPDKVLCGDLNSLPDSNVIRLINRVEPNMQVIQPSFKHREIWRGIKLPQSENLWEDTYEGYDQPSNITKRFQGRIDHIFYKGLKQRGRLQTERNEIAGKQSWLPNERFPSDHLPMGIKFELSG